MKKILKSYVKIMETLEKNFGQTFKLKKKEWWKFENIIQRNLVKILTNNLEPSWYFFFENFI